MKKIISFLSLFLFPVIASAQGYMMDSFNKGWSNNCNNFVLSGSVFGAFLLVPIIGGALAICVFIFWIMMLIDAIKHTSEKTKLVWVVVIIFTHVIGAVIYYFVEKKPRNKHVSGHVDHKE